MGRRLETTVTDLATALDLRARAHIAIVGGGGKTSLMFALADELVVSGYRVLTTTTTKIRHREALSAPLAVFNLPESARHERIARGLDKHKHVFFGRKLLSSGKVEGIDPLGADALYREHPADFLIAEADGAAGRPLKAPAPHEPVIPASATVVIAVMGLEAMGKNLTPELVFRLERFQALTGISLGMRVTPESLVRLFHSSKGLFKGAPPSARRVAFLNKRDLLSDHQEAFKLVDLLIRQPVSAVDRVVVGTVHGGVYSVSRKKP